MGKLIFAFAAIVVAIADIVLAVIVKLKEQQCDKYLFRIFLLTSEVAVSYLVTALCPDYFVMSLFSSFYYCGITAMLYYLFIYILEYTNLLKTRHVKFGAPFLFSFSVLDIVIELINPFWEISMHYNYRPGAIAMWQYEPKFLYQCHLILCYVLIAFVFACLIFRACNTPKSYRKKYLTVLYGILTVIIINGIFLLVQNENMLDYSILIYSIICIFLFWFKYYYVHHGMLNDVRQMILNELNQPMFLFDNCNELILSNKAGNTFLLDDKDSLSNNLESFTGFCKFPVDISNNLVPDIHFQWNYESPSGLLIYRIDVKNLKDKKNRFIGKVVVFTDTSLEMDLLTGFHSKNSFEGYFRNGSIKFQYPVAVAVCDINKLTFINHEYGEAAGDLTIQNLANLMRKIFPENTYFARLEEANLLAISPNTNMEQMRSYISEVRESINKTVDFKEPLGIQSAFSIVTEEKPNILEAASTSMYSIKFKKLMDGSSAHSSLLYSLIQTLQESDSTVKEHNERTGKMAELLGKRLGLSDIQLSKLALLCLLHDIGKLGIPLEILNKPGKLNSAEWDVMKSHVQKGYRIAMASVELQDIADLILHHHESWNGKGYPDGLKQEAIPLLSRIIAVVDSYDAMTNDRPYHRAVSDKKAREELVRCAGIQFDPMIVSEFVALLEELHPLKNQQENSEDELENQNSTSRGVQEAFSENVDADNVFCITYAKYQLNEEFKIISANEEFETLTGYSNKDLSEYNLTQWDLIPKEDKELYSRKVLEIVSKTGEAYLEHRIIRKDGSFRDVICLGKPVFNPDTGKSFTEIIAFDSAVTKVVLNVQKSERESAQRSLGKWEKLMRKDSLTGLLNHESFINDVEMELLKKDQKTVLLILDVDYFKTYNDSYGHLAGDKLLSLVALVLDEALIEYGFAGRLGGDEFAGVIRAAADASDEKIKMIVKKVFDSIMETISTQEQGATISMGAAYLNENSGFNKLYQKADKALYTSKENGRKCFSFFADEE